MNSLYYGDDLHGYDDLLTFVDVYPTKEEFVIGVNTYMWNIQVQDNENWEKIYNMLLDKYKNHFFRWSIVSDIHNNMAKRLSELYAQLVKGKYILENLKGIAGQSTTIENFKTNNTSDEGDPENNIKYRTDIETTFVDNGEKEIEIMDRMSSNAGAVNKWLNDIRVMFMNRTNEVVRKDIAYGKGVKNG